MCSCAVGSSISVRACVRACVCVCVCVCVMEIFAQLPKLTAKEGEQIPLSAGGGTEECEISHPAHHPGRLQRFP